MHTHTHTFNMHIPHPSSHYRSHSEPFCFLSKRTKKRCNSCTCILPLCLLSLMKILLGCTYIWLAPPNFHVKQAAHLHGNTAASRFRRDHVPTQYSHDTEHGHSSSPNWQFFTPNRYATSHLANSIRYRTCPNYTEQETRLRRSAIISASRPRQTK